MENYQFGIVHGGTYRKEPWGSSLSDVLERDDLHRALLFWDRISIPWADSPERPIIRGPAHDLMYLEAEGILDAPIYHVEDLPDEGPVVPLSHAGIVVLHDFFEREAKKPGLWCLSESADKLTNYESSSAAKSFFGLNQEVKSVRSALIVLKDTIPVPSGDIPLADLLEFKLKRRDELLELRSIIYSSYTSIASSKDSDAALRIVLAEIERSVENYLKVLRERKWPLRMFDWSLDFSIDATKVPPMLVSSAAGAQLGSGYSMGALGAVLGGIAPLLTLNASSGFDLGERDNPYRVLGQMDRELSFH